MIWLGQHIVEILSVIVSAVLSLYIARIAILQNKRITDIEENRQEHENFIFFKIEMNDNYILTKELYGHLTRSYMRVIDSFGYQETRLIHCPDDTFDKVTLNLKNVGNTHAETFEVLNFELLYFNPIDNMQTKYVPVKEDEIFKRSYVLQGENRYIHIPVKEAEEIASDKRSPIEMFSINLKIKYTDVTVKKPIIENIRFNGTLEGFEYENAVDGIPSDYEKLKIAFDGAAVTYSVEQTQREAKQNGFAELPNGAAAE
jgi:hypothetical protein